MKWWIIWWSVYGLNLWSLIKNSDQTQPEPTHDELSEGNSEESGSRSHPVLLVAWLDLVVSL
jgi:hypothetical protein